jgi:hypothetical protein
MKTFFISFRVIPTDENEHYSTAEGAIAGCWIVENDHLTATTRASFHISKDAWSIQDIDTPAVEVTEDCFRDRDIGLEQFQRAQKEGIAIFYAAWSKDKKSQYGPFKLRQNTQNNIGDFLNKQKILKQKGRCLHFAANDKCKEFINAHSIQREQSLTNIAIDGHVYTLSAKYSSIKKSKGRPSIEKESINKVSTFYGFCKKHDNELFAPIDKAPLWPTDEQVVLYAYRSLCRELFVKQNSYELLISQEKSSKHNRAIKDFFEAFTAGTENGLENLRRHKIRYDKCLKDKSYFDIRYVLFSSKQPPVIYFSGLLYPHFDFMGRQLQNLGNLSSENELITFCSAPMATGWGYLFAWHKDSSSICVEFMKSLATTVYNGADLGDLLLRFVISNCENFAISPRWWESLPENEKEIIRNHAALGASPFSVIKPTYLLEGLEGVSKWEFETVQPEME